MNSSVQKYLDKLLSAGMVNQDRVLFGVLDQEMYWNRTDPMQRDLEKIVRSLNLSSILFSQPAEPYLSITEYFSLNHSSPIYPLDCGTRTINIDIPILEKYQLETILETLSYRKSVLIPGQGVITCSTLGPKEVFISYSCTCYGCFVKFFSEYLWNYQRNELSTAQTKTMQHVKKDLETLPETFQALKKGPLDNEENIYQAMNEVGKLTVQNRLVDSFFGNVSVRLGDTLYISQSGSFLDELAESIEACNLMETHCACASSEYRAHRDTILTTDNNCLLHGHPKFSVIMSMDCPMRDNCVYNGQCEIKCPENRYIQDIPIVPGEVGAGYYGLCHTLVPVIQENRGVIVYGHGLFTVGETDFNQAFSNLLDVERTCREMFFRKIGF